MVSALKGLLKRCVPAKIHMRLRILHTRLRYFALLPWMSGSRYSCPFCAKRFGRFFPDGLDLPVFKEKDIVSGALTPNLRCPWCWSSERDRLLYAYFQRRPHLLSEAKKILHLAPEYHLQKLFRAKRGIAYLSGDLQSPIAMARMDILRLPVASGTADAVLCNHVLEHIPEDKSAMQEILRVLKPNGWAILQVPIARGIASTEEDASIVDPKERERRYGQFDHVRIYEQANYKQRLSAAGFEVTIENCLELFGPERVEKWRLNPREDVHLCRKP